MVFGGTDLLSFLVLLSYITFLPTFWTSLRLLSIAGLFFFYETFIPHWIVLFQMSLLTVKFSLKFSARVKKAVGVLNNFLSVSKSQWIPKLSWLPVLQSGRELTWFMVPNEFVFNQIRKQILVKKVKNSTALCSDQWWKVTKHFCSILLLVHILHFWRLLGERKQTGWLSFFQRRFSLFASS